MKKKILRVLLILVCLFLVFILFRQRKVYYFHHVDNSENSEFCSEQLEELSNKDAIINISMTNVMFIRSNSLVFTVFSKKNFKELKIEALEIFYDNKHKKVGCKKNYIPDDTNPNFVNKKSYDIDGINYQGFEKEIFPPFNKDKYCWVNFYNMFKWKHKKVNDTFPVTIICHYYLDDQEYYEELHYTVECEKSFPDRLYKAFFCLQ